MARKQLGAAPSATTDAVTKAYADTKEPAISAGTSTQYWRGDKTWQTLGRPAVPEVGTVSSATTLTLTTASSAYIFTGGSAATWTLPAVSGNTGFPLILANRGTATVTVQRAGTDNIYGVGGTLTSLALTAGSEIQLFNDSVYWMLMSYPVTALNATGTPSSTTYLRGDGSWNTPGGATVTVYAGVTSVSGVSVPAGALGCYITMIGPGGPGGSGRRGATSTLRYGGGGGGGAGYIPALWIPVAALGATYAVTIPAVAAGGAAITVDSTNGNNGTAAANATFVSGSYSLTVESGNFGGGGTATASVAGAGIVAGSSGHTYVASVAGTSGAGTANAVAASFNDGLGVGCAGGGGGGGLTSANNPGTAAAGSNSIVHGLTGGAGGVVAGASPGTGGTALGGVTGPGAGGGAASVAGAAQAGANATHYGAGGGGGGASVNGQTSGAGGNGGPGYVSIAWV